MRFYFDYNGDTEISDHSQQIHSVIHSKRMDNQVINIDYISNSIIYQKKTYSDSVKHTRALHVKETYIQNKNWLQIHRFTNLQLYKGGSTSIEVREATQL